MSDKTLTMTMLLDFYGELLTEKQRTCFSMHYNEDLSMGEIAELLGISRQGVYDLITRAESSLMEKEKKVGLVARFSGQRTIIDRMTAELTELRDITDGRAEEIAESLLTELEALRQ